MGGYYTGKVVPLLSTVKAKGGDGSWPAGLGSWGPCPKCFPSIEDIIRKADNCPDNLDDRKEILKKRLTTLLPNRHFSVDINIDTPFEHTFFKEMMKIVGDDASKKSLTEEILKTFQDAVLDKWNVGDYVSLGFNKSD